MHVAIVGAYGSAGVATASELSKHIGEEINELSLIDGGQPGGLCILRGCMPSKAVLSGARHVHEANNDARVKSDATVDTLKTIKHKNKNVNAFAEHRASSVRSLAEKSGVNLIEESARFENENKLVLSDGGVINPDYTVVATGSKVNIPSLDGINEVDYLTSSDVLDMDALPDSVVVMGFGTIGIEMSAYLSTAGVDVTVIEHDELPLDEASDALSRELVDIYTDEFGINIVNNTYEEAVEKEGDKIRVYTDSDRYFEADELCLFTGRTPNVQGLDLNTLGVKPEKDWVNDDLLVNGTDSVFVAGDATGERMILHIAKEQGHLVSNNIIKSINGSESEPYNYTEHLVYFAGNGKYPFAKYGISADSAIDEPNLEVVTRRASDDGIFKLKDAEYGVANLVVNSETGEVKGYEGLHLHSDVMVKTMQVLIENNVDVRNVPSRAYHPTTPEILDGLLRDASSKIQ